MVFSYDLMLCLIGPRTVYIPEIVLGISSFLRHYVRTVEAFLVIKLLTFNDLLVSFLVCTVSVFV